jgi:Asp-tRNA(Asn)/Glu-tRNA(Gln) amidotransferase A subunit family amidase
VAAADVAARVRERVAVDDRDRGRAPGATDPRDRAARRPPEDDEIDAYAGVLAPLAVGGTRFALLRTRPGGGRPDANDRAWARALYDAGRRAGAHLEVIHLAHDHDVLPLAMDDLLAEPA